MLKVNVNMKYLDNKDFSQNLYYRRKLLDDLLLAYMKKEIDSEDMRRNIYTIKKFRLNLRQTIHLENLRYRIRMLQDCFFNIDPLLSDVFRQARNIVYEWGGELVVVYIPSWERFQKTFVCRKRLLSIQHQQVLALLQELDIPVIDIKQVLDSYNDPHSLYPYRLRVTGHFNSKGYKLIAKKILDYIDNN